MSIVKVLTDARAMVERGWTQGWFARDAAGNKRYELDESAVCWCMAGAYMAVAPGLASWEEAEDFLKRAIGEESVPDWNDVDGRTQAEVLAAFDRAIELANEANA
jgi:hypothetical protein